MRLASQDVSHQFLSISTYHLSRRHHLPPLSASQNLHAQKISPIQTANPYLSAADCEILGTLSGEKADLLTVGIPSSNSIAREEHASFVTDTNLANQLASRCEFSVVVPVLATAAQGLADHSLHTNDVLGQGFEVEWIIDETQCRACVESGGICRYNSTLQKHFVFVVSSVAKLTLPVVQIHRSFHLLQILLNQVCALFIS
ncbi:hypothetical protein AAG906_014029 [Vitis piasezkii]